MRIPFSRLDTRTDGELGFYLYVVFWPDVQRVIEISGYDRLENGLDSQFALLQARQNQEFDDKCTSLSADSQASQHCFSATEIMDDFDIGDIIENIRKGISGGTLTPLFNLRAGLDGGTQRALMQPVNAAQSQGLLATYPSLHQDATLFMLSIYPKASFLITIAPEDPS